MVGRELGADERQIIELMSQLDADDRDWMIAVIRAVTLVEPDDTQWLLNAALRHRRADLRRRLDRLNDVHA